jgi:hypothetical protein
MKQSISAIDISYDKNDVIIGYNCGMCHISGNPIRDIVRRRLNLCRDFLEIFFLEIFGDSELILKVIFIWSVHVHDWPLLGNSRQVGPFS